MDRGGVKGHAGNARDGERRPPPSDGIGRHNRGARPIGGVPAEVFPRNPTTDLYRESLATTLVLHLATYHGQTAGVGGPDDVAPLPPARLRAISDYISDHISDTIALADLTRLIGLSASRFAPRFRAATGQTPHQFVTSVRVDRARELLVAGEHTITNVAALTGFADQSHLTRHVRRAFGVTPGAIRGR